jgi:Flp pilus assembly protein TadG
MTTRLSHLFAFASAHRFAADQRGVSAVEFAILLPLMLTLYFGGIGIADAVSADRKNTLVAHTVGDLVATKKDVTTADITDVWNANQWVAYPYRASNLVAVVSSVCVDTNGRATISWSQASNNSTQSAHTVGSQVSLPTALTTNTTGGSISYIWGESTYNYTPIIGYGLTGTIHMHDQFYLGPRQSCSVTLNGTTASKCC